MKTLKLIGCILILAISWQIQSEPNDPFFTKHQNGVSHGLGAGGTVFWSWGFLYRQHFANNFGFATSFGGWFDSNDGYLGNELGILYTLAHHHFNGSALPNSSLRVYGIAYLANIYRLEDQFVPNEKPKGFIKKNIWDVGLGVGPGLEFFFNRNFALHAELPWMTFVRFMDKSASFKSSYPHFGGGFTYYF